MEHKFHIHFSEMTNSKSGADSKLSRRQGVILNSWPMAYITWGFVWLSFLFQTIHRSQILPGHYKILAKQTPFIPRMILIPNFDDSLGFVTSSHSQTTSLVWWLFNCASINNTSVHLSSAVLVNVLFWFTLSVLAIQPLTLCILHIFKTKKKTLPENTFTLSKLTPCF